MLKQRMKLQQKVEIFDEVLAFSYKSKNDKMRKAPLIDTRTDELFTPKAKMQELVGNDKEKYMDLLVTKRLTKATSRSFIFSREQYRRNCRNELYMKLIESLYMFGHRELFVIDTESIGLISLNTLPLVFKYRNETSEAVGGVLLSLNGPALIPEDTYGIVENVIKNMNIVLEQLVPGLRIGVVDLGSTMTKDGKIAKQIQLISLPSAALSLSERINVKSSSILFRKFIVWLKPAGFLTRIRLTVLFPDLKCSILPSAPLKFSIASIIIFCSIPSAVSAAAQPIAL